jgi:hypothetical protein
MQTRRGTSVELSVYALTFLAALALRLAEPGWPLLDDDQAVHALAAAAAGGVPMALLDASNLPAPIHGLYHAWTALLFQLGGATNTAARLLPALAGSLLVLVPWALRRTFGRWPALFAAVLLALTPVLVTASRGPGSGITALLAFGLALAGLHTWPAGRGADIAIGALIGAGLASGPHAITGLVGLGVGSLLYLGARGRWLEPLPAATSRSTGRLVLAGIAGFLGAAAAFGLVPSGLVAALGAPGNWLAAWGNLPAMPTVTWLGFSVLYQPLLLLLGVAGVIIASSERNAFSTWVACWALGGMVTALMLPARSIDDWIWPSAALALLGGVALARMRTWLGERDHLLSRLALGFALFVVGCFALLEIAGLAGGFGTPGFLQFDPARQALLVGAALAMVILLIVMVGLGWSWRESWIVLASVSALFLIGANLNAVWRLNFNAMAGSGQELRTRTSASDGQNLLVDTLETVAEPRRTSLDPVDVRAYGVVPPSLLWSLRGSPVAWEQGAKQEGPGILVMPADSYDSTPPALTADYLGQALPVLVSWGWQGWFPPDLVNWYLRGTAPVEYADWLVLVRSDLVVPDSLPGVTGAP